LFSEARSISKFAQDLFTKGEADQVDILYTNFISTLNQKPELIPFLPVVEIKGVGTGAREGAELTKSSTEFLFEPGIEGVLAALLPHYLNFRVYQILLEAKASEHSSRMVAMKNATDNAQQIIKDLTLEYNKLRQANITKELLEITSAAMAMS
jgi:F-type H+-transporting ATPase subunit gamma